MKSVAIIGGGVAGMEAAAQLAGKGFAVTIIEKGERLGGRLNQWHALFPRRESATKLLDHLHSRLDGVTVVLNAVVTGVERNDDGFAVHIDHNRMITANAVLLSTGFDIFDASRKEEYGYGIYDNVITSVDLESRFKSGQPLTTAKGETPHRIGFIHCVGSRDEKAGNMHCSKVCCVTAVKQAIELKEMYPSAEVYLYYMDLRMFGRHFEEMYKEAQQKYGIQFVRARLSEAFENPDGSVQIKIEDTLLAKPLKMNLDLLVLMVGIQPDKKPDNMIDMFGLPKDADGFLLQEDQYILPFSTKIAGLYSAGGSRGPKTIEEALNEARAVAAEITTFLGDCLTYMTTERAVIGL